MIECHIYVESSITWPKKGDGIVGLIFTDKDEKHTRQLFGVVHNSTMHHAVLFGIKNALGYCTQFDVIHIHTSDAYVANAFKWLDKWNASSWIKSNGQPVQYATEWQAIYENLKQKNLEIHLGEFNGFRNWIKNECVMRGRKHGFIL